LAYSGLAFFSNDMTYPFLTFRVGVGQLPTLTALLSDWRVSDSSPLAHLRERTCELDIGAFSHCKDSTICFVRLAYDIAKAEE